MATITASLGHVNAADATAGFKTYANIFAETQGLNVRVEVTIFDNLEELKVGAAREELEVIGLPTHEYLKLKDDLPLDLMFIAEKSGEITETYVLVVRTDSSVDDLAQLQGKDLIVLSSSQMGMSRFWLDVKLLESGMPRSSEFFGSVENQTKPLTTIIPVFFKKADACLVTMSGLDLMTEMNPQVGHELRVIETSPSIVPFVTCIRSDFEGSNRLKLERAYLQAHSFPAGKQLLLLFQYDKMRLAREEDLETARDIYTAHQKFRKGPSAGGHVP